MFNGSLISSHRLRIHVDRCSIAILSCHWFLDILLFLIHPPSENFSAARMMFNPKQGRAHFTMNSSSLQKATQGCLLSSPGQAETSNCILNKFLFKHHGQIQEAGKGRSLPRVLPGRGSCSKSCRYPYTWKIQQQSNFQVKSVKWTFRASQRIFSCNKTLMSRMEGGWGGQVVKYLYSSPLWNTFIRAWGSMVMYLPYYYCCWR